MTYPATCAKCGQPEVRVVAANRDAGASIPIAFWRSARTTHHVCTSCGFVETYVSERDKLAAIAKKWPLAK